MEGIRAGGDSEPGQRRGTQQVGMLGRGQRTHEVKGRVLQDVGSFLAVVALVGNQGNVFAGLGQLPVGAAVPANNRMRIAELIGDRKPNRRRAAAQSVRGSFPRPPWMRCVPIPASTAAFRLWGPCPGQSLAGRWNRLHLFWGLDKPAVPVPQTRTFVTEPRPGALLGAEPCAYGYRPRKSAQDAIQKVDELLHEGYTDIVDADLSKYFDKISHEWLVQFVEHRIQDKRIVRLIQKWLKAGVMEQGQWLETEEGTPQGSVISPILANLYLHYVLDVWADVWRKKLAQGDVIIVRYADDAVLGFQYREEAEKFLGQLRERLRKFGLELHPDKTRLIEFGRYAAERRKRRGEGKPETFNFLGFTHICGTSPQTGRFAVRRITIGKRMAAKLREIRSQLRRRMHGAIGNTAEWLRKVVRGYFQYHAIPGNQARPRAFRKDVLRMWLRQLRRRSQRSRWTWKRFLERLGDLLPAVEILHPHPAVRFYATHPR